MSESHDELVRKADAARSRLLVTVEKLEKRHRERLDPRLQLRRLARPLAMSGVLLLALGAAGAGLFARHFANPDRRRRRERWTLLKDMWRHPERAMRGERRSLADSVLRSLLLTLVTTTLSVSVHRMLAGRDVKSPAMVPFLQRDSSGESGNRRKGNVE